MKHGIAICHLLLLFGLLLSCNLKEPVLPAWEVLARVPLIVDDLVLGDQLVDSSNFIIKGAAVDPDSILFLRLDGGIHIAEVSRSDFSFEPGNSYIRAEIGDISIDTFEPIELSLGIDELIDLRDAVGQTVDVPEQTLDSPPLSAASGDFERVHFVSGLVRLRIINHLPLTIGSNSTSDGLLISVFGAEDSNEPFTQLVFMDSIPPGAVGIAETEVSDRWLVSPVSVEMEIPLRSRTLGITEQMLDTSAIGISFELESVQTDEIVARLESHEFSARSTIDVDAPVKLRSAEIESGKISIKIVNQLQIGSDVLVVFSEIIDNNDGQPLVVPISLLPGETWNDSLVLDGFEIRDPQSPGEFIDSLEVLVQAVTIADGEFVSIKSSDTLSVEINTDSLIFSHFDGYVDSASFAIRPIVQDHVANYGEFEGGIQLQQAVMEMDITNAIYIENLELDLQVTGFHQNSGGVITDSATVFINDILFSSSQPDMPSSTEIVIDQGLVDFLTILPTKVVFTGRVHIAGEASISIGDTIGSRYSFETPITLQVLELATFKTAPEVIDVHDISAEVHDAADENLLGADLELGIINHTPLGGILRYIISADIADENIYRRDAGDDTSLVITDSIAVLAGSVDPLSGFVAEAWTEDFTLGLNRREMQLLNEPGLRTGFEWKIPRTEGFVTLRYSDFIELIGKANIRILIKDSP